MREAAFINKNKERWETLEKLLRVQSYPSPDEMSGLFVQLTDDLSYARTFYPESKIVPYLNGLSQALHQYIYRNKKAAPRQFGKFWLIDVPLLIGHHHTKLLLSFIVFGTAVLIGAISAAYDETFVRLIVGDAYVDMTLQNIREGKPMDVYANGHSSDMFLFISVNNIRVAFLAFIAGTFCSLGTLILLASNGIMLGAFQYFFVQKGLLVTSVLSIWIHGTLEITAIVVAGAAGFTLGNGFLFPGTYPRGYSFRKGAMDGVKIVSGLIPVFILAAFLEGFVTRLSPEMHPAWSILIISCSALFVIFYFVIYPIRLQRRIEFLNPKAKLP